MQILVYPLSLNNIEFVANESQRMLVNESLQYYIHDQG